jgi:hypothetical protein
MFTEFHLWTAPEQEIYSTKLSKRTFDEGGRNQTQELQKNIDSWTTERLLNALLKDRSIVTDLPEQPVTLLYALQMYGQDFYPDRYRQNS